MSSNECCTGCALGSTACTAAATAAAGASGALSAFSNVASDVDPVESHGIKLVATLVEVYH